jgi:hypothetical protein
MLIRWRILLGLALIAAWVAWGYGFASWEGLTGQICDQSANPQQEQCPTYNAMLVLLWHIREGLNDYAPILTAVATVAIAAFTWTLWRATTEHSRIQGGLLELTRDEFNAAHRPKIVIHSVKYEPATNEKDSDLDTLGARIIFYNRGRSDATIEAIEYSLRQRLVPLESGILLHDRIPPKHSLIESGRGDYIQITSDIEVRTVRFVTDASSRIFLIGKIFYRDKLGGLRQTGFCRVFGGTAARRAWERIDDPEYEYSY